METSKIYDFEMGYLKGTRKNDKHRSKVICAGFLQTEIFFDWREDDKWQEGYKTETVYNEDNQPLTIHDFVPQGEGWQSICKINYQYDRRGRKIEEVQLDEDNTPEERSVYDYHLDNDGNGFVRISEEKWNDNSWRKVSQYTEHYVEQKIISRKQHSRELQDGKFYAEWNDEYKTYSYEIAAGLYRETIVTSRMGLTEDGSGLGDWEEKEKTIIEKDGSKETWTLYSKHGEEWVAVQKGELTKGDNIIIAQKDYAYEDGDWVLEYEVKKIES